MPEHILSLSYGKDSLACLGAIEQLGWPLDRIVHAEMWATDTIPADLPPMAEFKAKADKIIKDRWGIDVGHYDTGESYEHHFYRIRSEKSPTNGGVMYGWPMRGGTWCNSDLKMRALRKARAEKGNIIYIGIAADEPNRFHNLTETKKSPLVEAEWDEAYCRQWCEENNLLSPIYTTATRGGCWFCHNQGVGQLRLLRKNYPEYWTRCCEGWNYTRASQHESLTGGMQRCIASPTMTPRWRKTYTEYISCATWATTRM